MLFALLLRYPSSTPSTPEPRNVTCSDPDFPVTESLSTSSSNIIRLISTSRYPCASFRGITPPLLKLVLFVLLPKCSKLACSERVSETPKGFFPRNGTFFISRSNAFCISLSPLVSPVTPTPSGSCKSGLFRGFKTSKLDLNILSFLKKSLLASNHGPQPSLNGESRDPNFNKSASSMPLIWTTFALTSSSTGTSSEPNATLLRSSL
uniref:Uncharacterized protein n=1 Tax=Opuntia streptacantha TaxID=393608 RepID=A0A7C9ELA6_OPUST